jgi:hypothetical protein
VYGTFCVNGNGGLDRRLLSRGAYRRSESNGTATFNRWTEARRRTVERCRPFCLTKPTGRRTALRAKVTTAQDCGSM